MSFPNESPLAQLPGLRVCPECQAAGLMICAHVIGNPAVKPQPLRNEFNPAASAALLKTALISATVVLGYIVWRFDKSRTDESDVAADPTTPFDEWEASE